MKILFVEDNVHTSQALKLMLELRDYSVDTSASVAEAIGRLSSSRYDLLISDMNLPDGSGYDILASGPTSMPSIAVSGYFSDSDKLELRRRGFSDCLVKPFRVEQLADTIGQVMNSPL